MVGGSRRELWPLCRAYKPKPFVDLFNDGSLLARTLQRALRLVGREQLIVVADARLKAALAEQLTGVLPRNLILEPFGRGTAACLGLAAAYVRKRDPAGLLVVLPSDQLVFDEAAFQETLAQAAREARRSDAIVCIGVRPKSAETLYGYIQAGEEYPSPESASFRRVRTFAEKPDLQTALRFVQSGDFFWNSGIFVTSLETLATAFGASTPELHRDLLNIYEAIGTHAERRVIAEAYESFHALSIDSVIMEGGVDVVMLEGVFGWCDPGSWDEVVAAASERTMFSSEHGVPGVVACDAEGLFVRKPEGKVVCVVGAGELIIVDTPDALLVCAKGSADRIGEALEEMRRAGLSDRL